MQNQNLFPTVTVSFVEMGRHLEPLSWCPRFNTGNHELKGKVAIYAEALRILLVLRMAAEGSRFRYGSLLRTRRKGVGTVAHYDG